MVETEPAKRALKLLKNSMEDTISLKNGQRPGPLEPAHIRNFERLQEKEGK